MQIWPTSQPRCARRFWNSSLSLNGKPSSFLCISDVPQYLIAQFRRCWLIGSVMPASFWGWPKSWPDFDYCRIDSTRKPFKNNLFLLLLLLFNLGWTQMNTVPHTVASTAKYPDTIPVPQWNCNLILKFCSVMHLLYCLSFLSWIKLSKCFSFSCFRRIFQHIQI